MKRVPCFVLQVPPGVRIEMLEVFIEPPDWLTRLLWRWLSPRMIDCVWTEEVE